MIETLPAETAVGRVALTVTDAERVAQFYETVVGLVVHDRAGPVVLGDGHNPLLVLFEDSEAPERTRDEAGLFHTAFRVPDRAALADVLTRVEDEWRLSGASDHLVSEALYCSDPEGNGVEIYRDRPRSVWTETAGGGVEMATEPLDLSALREKVTGASTVPTGTDVGHVHLEGTSLDEARAFYVDALGMGVRTTYDGALFLAAGDYHHHVGVNVWNRRSTPRRGRGLAWFELRLPDQEALDRAVDRLSTSGYAVDSTVDGATVDDPMGVTLKLRS